MENFIKEHDYAILVYAKRTQQNTQLQLKR